MTDNELLELIQADTSAILDAVSEEYSSIISTQGAVGVGSPVTRAANANARKTVVTSEGASDVEVAEDGNLVAILTSGQSWVSPLSGNKAISVSLTSGTATATITTYIK